MGRQPSDQLSAAENFSVIPPAGAHRSSLRRPPCDGGRPLGRNARRAPGTSRRFLYTSQAGAPPAVARFVLQCSLPPFSASQARTGVFSAVTGHRPPRHGVDGGRRASTLPWPRPAAPAEPIRIGVTPGTPILSRRRPRHGPSDVRPAFGGGAQDLPASAQNLRRLCTGFPSHSPCGDASPRSWSGSPPMSGEPPGRRPPPPSISFE